MPESPRFIVKHACNPFVVISNQGISPWLTLYLDLGRSDKKMWLGCAGFQKAAHTKSNQSFDWE